MRKIELFEMGGEGETMDWTSRKPHHSDQELGSRWTWLGE